ncbi:MAG: ABC transporter substrate-binding protein [Deltaproteobacteria bacterium]|nr:ABC transporter substrate-binding protein [Deltaproteobacteria bacterium]
MKTTKGWRACMAVGALILGLVLFLPEAQAAKKIVFSTGVDTSFCQVPIAKEKGFFKKYDLDVTVKKFTAGVEGFKSLLAGESNASISATPGVIAALAQDAPIRIIGTSRAATGPYAAVVATSDIQKPQDLHGRNVGVAWGTSGSHMFFLLYCKYHKLDRDKINVKQLQPQEMMIAFSRGDIDAFFSWPPWWTRGLQVRKGAHVLAQSNDHNVHIGTQTLVISAKLAEDKEAVKGIVRAFFDAEKFKAETPKATVEMLAKEYNMTEKEVADELKAQTHRLELSELSFQDFCNSARFMIETKKVERAPNWKAGILVEYLKELDPSRLTYKRFIDCR